MPSFAAWQNRVKGRDWYDLVWYVTHHPMLNLSHLEERMRQSGHWQGGVLTSDAFRASYAEKVAKLDVDQAREEVAPFVKNLGVLEVWSREFFLSLGDPGLGNVAERPKCAIYGLKSDVRCLMYKASGPPVPLFFR